MQLWTDTKQFIVLRYQQINAGSQKQDNYMYQQQNLSSTDLEREAWETDAQTQLISH